MSMTSTKRFPEGGGRFGLHHVALMVDDLEETVGDPAKQGLAEAMRVSVPE